MLRRMILFAIAVPLLNLCAAAALPAAAMAAPDPTEQLRPFVDKIVALLTDDALQGEAKKKERREKVMAVAHERFDFAEMSKRVLGSQWRQLSTAEQAEFTALFTRLLEHAYIGKIEDYSRQEVVFKGQRIKGDRAQVETELVDKDVMLPVSYIMILKGNDWMAYDIIVEGVSLIRNYMEQFREIIRGEGYPRLVQRIEDKVRELESGAVAPGASDLLPKKK